MAPNPYKISKHYVNSCKNQDNGLLYTFKDKPQKGLVHYNRDFNGSGSETYRRLICIWLSKILLFEHIIENNPFNTPYFAWVDAGFGKIPRKLLDIPIHVDKFNTNCGSLFYKHLRIINGAGYMIANTEIWQTVILLYKDMLKKQKHSNYAHDEETLLRLIYKNNQHLFITI